MVRYQNLTRKPELFRALQPSPPRPRPGYDVPPEPPHRRPWLQLRWAELCEWRLSEEVWVLLRTREMVSKSCKKRRAKEKKTKNKYSCKYKQNWEKDYPSRCRSQKGDEYAKCNSYRIGISEARGGKNNVTKHVTFKNHIKSIAAEKKKSRVNQL